mgnify:CR=1 FL=1
MTHISVERQGKTFHVPEATIEDLIALMEEQYSQDRIDMLADLEEIGASDELRLEKLKELRDAKGLTAALMRSAFNLTGATRIITYMVKSPDREAVLDGTPDEVVWLALRILGFESNDSDEPIEEAEEGKVLASPEASTQTS